MANLSRDLYAQSKQFDDNIYCDLLYSDENNRITFGTFKEKSLLSANGLKYQGISAGTRVLVVMPDLIEGVGLIHSLIHIGAEIFVAHAETDLDVLLDMCQKHNIRTAISNDFSVLVASKIRGTIDDHLLIEDLYVMSYGALDTAHEYQDTDVVLHYLQQTRSGEFSHFQFTHQEMVKAIEKISSWAPFDQESNLLLSTPVSHPVGTMLYVFAPFVTGNTCGIVGSLFNPRSFLALVNKRNINVIILDLYSMESMLRYKNHDLHSQDIKVYVTGDRLSDVMKQRWRSAYGTDVNEFYFPDQSLWPVDLSIKNAELRIVDGVVEFLSVSGNWISTGDCAKTVNDHHEYIGRRAGIRDDINIEVLEELILKEFSVESCCVRFDHTGNLRALIVPLTDLDLELISQKLQVPITCEIVDSIPVNLDHRRFDHFLSQ